MSQTETLSGFAALHVPARLVEVLSQAGITEPTPIQAQSIPPAMDGNDLIGIAQTGTGKTLAFALPMVRRLERGELGLVLAPTRELAQQIAETYAKLGVRCTLVVGGDPMFRQVRDLRNRPTVIVATPGRLIDHLQQKTVRLDRVTIAVLDEADRMLDMGFAPAIDRIFAELPEVRQTLLFSATMPPSIADLAGRLLKDPVTVQVAPAGTPSHLIEQELLYIRFEEKHDTLHGLLGDHEGPVLVFARTRHGARKLAAAMRDLGHTAAEIHADRTLAQRRAAMHGFKSGYFRVLVATDIAARGIDVKEIALVVNFDLPDNPEDYVHRIGRTGRAGNEGKAVTLALPEQVRDVRDIERLLGADLPISARSTALPRVQSRPGGGGRRASGPRREYRSGGRQHQDAPAEGAPQPAPRDRAPLSEGAPSNRLPQSDFFAEQREREMRDRPQRQDSYGDGGQARPSHEPSRPGREADRPRWDRPAREGGRVHDERPNRDGARNHYDRPARPAGERPARPPYDRAARDGARPQFDRPNRDGARPPFERPNRDGARPPCDRAARDGARPQFDRPNRDGARPPFERPNRDGARPHFDRSPRPNGPNASKQGGAGRPASSGGNGGATPPKRAHRGWSGKPGGKPRH